MTRKHHGADRVVQASRPQREAEMNVTPLIDAAKGAGVDRLGVVTPGMKGR